MAGESTVSSRGRLTALQRAVLAAFFARERDALAKDGGCTPATLAWLLDQVTIPEDLSLPGGVPARDLRAWLGGLVERLRRFAHPGP